MKKTERSIAALLLCALMLFAGCGKSEAAYTAGVYTASAAGYAGPVTAEVKFDDHSILAVRIISHHETLDIGDRAINELPDKIVKAQSWDVDAITAATVTSGAIRAAVKDCMAQAAIEK